MKKEELLQYGKNIAKIEELEEKREELRAMTTATQAKVIDGMPLGSSSAGNARFEELIDKIEDVELKIARLKNENERIRLDLLCSVSMADFQILKTIYLDGLTMEATAEKLSYSARHLYRLRDKALENLEKSDQTSA